MKTHVEKIFRVLVVTLLLIAGCGGTNGAPSTGEPAADDQPPAPEPATTETPPTAGGGAGLANPASVNCVERGGRLEMIEGPGGTSGVCLFDDGSRCEEWRFFRGQCNPGDCRERSGSCD
jgi:putative hemolysin